MKHLVALVVVVAALGCGGGDTQQMLAGPMPDAGHSHPACESQACGLPGDDACCANTSCIDFHDFGSKQCVEQCKTDADCTSGCCQPTAAGTNVCSPKEYCGEGGIYPEAICRDADTCDVANNQSACVSAVESCLTPLTQSQKSEWFSAVAACYAPSSNTCSNLFNCLRYDVPYCHF